LTVGEIADAFAISQPAISKHVRVLEESGLLRRRVAGRVHHCTLEPSAMGSAAAWIDRTGGSYRITMLRPDGERWLDSLLTLEFNAFGGETEVVLTHAQLASVESRDRHEGGWSAILDQLAKIDLGS